MKITIALNWFHRKVGPMVFYNYPEDGLEEDQKIRISDGINAAFDEGFFSRSFDNLITLNYYFEIHSAWARGGKEMLMISVVFDSPISSDNEHEVLALCIDFADKLKRNDIIFKAFYKEELVRYNEDRDLIDEHTELVEFWVKELYWSTIEVSREKSEEEIIAVLMSQKSIYEVIKFLSNGPIALEDLHIWFNANFPGLSLYNIIQTLEKDKIAFINDIGVEVYVLLLKDIRVERLPPAQLFTLFEEKPELIDLTAVFIERVEKYFSTYNQSVKDSLELFELVANPKIYNLISKLRTGPIPKNNIAVMISDAQAKEIFNHLKTLKEKNVIDEFEYNDEIHILLVTDIRFTTAFPDYLARLIPKETKVQIAKGFTTSSEQKIVHIGLETDDLESGLTELDAQELKDLVKKSSFLSEDDEEE